MARKIVTLGQRFQETGSPRFLWEVEYVYSDRYGVSHARLRNLVTGVDARTYSCEVLTDPRRFKSVAAPLQDSSLQPEKAAEEASGAG